MSPTATLRSIRSGARRVTRRHRRPIAAALAGLAALVALTAVRAPTPATPAVSTIVDPAVVRTGEVLVPVTLTSSATAAVLDVGDIVDLVAVHDGGTSEVIASGARVVERPPTGGGLASSAGALIVVAVDEATAVPLAVSSTRDTITVVISDTVPGTDT